MGILIAIGVAMGLAIMPFAILAGLLAMAVLIWCWGRIGRYFINFGRWAAHWRNFVPLTVLGTLVVVALIAFMLVLRQLIILWVILLVLHLIVTIVFLSFAMIAWIVWFFGWFWPKYRRWLWSVFLALFGQRHAGRTRRRRQAGPPPTRPVTVPAPGAQPGGGERPLQKRSALGSFWDLMLGRPPQRAKAAAAAQPSAANVQPLREATPAKRSWFGTFWALMLGKPEPKRQQARPTRVQTTEQTLGPSGTVAATAGAESRISGRPPSPTGPASGRKPAKRSWFSSFWALMTGRPSKTAPRRVQPQELAARDRAERPPRPEAAEAKTGAAARVTKATSGEKPARRGFFSGMWNSIVRGVTFVVGLIILAVLWVVQKMRDGIDWIRVRLNLD